MLSYCELGDIILKNRAKEGLAITVIILLYSTILIGISYGYVIYHALYLPLACLLAAIGGLQRSLRESERSSVLSVCSLNAALVGWEPRKD